MKHNHHNHCLHTNMGYCSECNVAYCRNCGKEWGNENFWSKPYTYRPYWITYTAGDGNTGTFPDNPDSVSNVGNDTLHVHR